MSTQPPQHEPIVLGASIVICAYSESRLAALREAVDGILAQQPRPEQVLVVIDHNDALLRCCGELLPGVEVVASDAPAGLSGARNHGVHHARAEIVVFLDDDACPQPGWLEALMAPFADPGVIGAGGVALPAWQSMRPQWFPDEFLWVVGCSYRGLPTTVSEIRNPIGANMAFRRDALRQVGGFAHGLGRVEANHLGCEETELSIRAAQVTGGQIVQVPTAVVHHRVTSERATWGYFWRRCWSEGLSKALVTHRVGGSSALATERTYTSRTLPLGVIAATAAAIRGDRWGLARAGAILTGVAVTASGYLVGLARMRRRAPRRSRS